MAKYTLKILLCKDRKIFKVCSTLFQQYTLCIKGLIFIWSVTPLFIAFLFYIYDKEQDYRENLISFIVSINYSHAINQVIIPWLLSHLIELLRTQLIST